MDILYQLRWQDILDILLVAVILYWLLLLIKGTKAAQILIGLVVLFFAFLFSGYIGLYTMDWLIQSFWAQIVLVLVILFQPEIRRALAQMGEARFLPSFASAEELKSLEEIVRATIALSNRKIGGLIVIERETSLRDFIEIGTPLDAKVSHELLLSIFHPTSPIHDGAVIIRGNRVVAAGCFLPLSLSAELSKAVGTRHRAGVGLSEETDAVVIIISEETGSIATAVGGTLEKNVDMGSLRDFLTEMFTSSKKRKHEK
ncbi:MAG: diadenylate cyclase CdaA [Thermodesulfovibrionia bacterium]|nr:diadenylate cyclase CdaA [Thermodesulfovibrionia bacterium]MCK5427539.1 diadenylate cyclase CdaA [Thermodesulfovibrionia bacterium]MCK5512108.1 diadenylate cyclase CdaA [Thermodesulfovibrionia bacterium]